jgi:hypothetical protein
MVLLFEVGKQENLIYRDFAIPRRVPESALHVEICTYETTGRDNGDARTGNLVSVVWNRQEGHD